MSLARSIATDRPLGASGGLIILLILLAALLAEVIAPYGFNEASFAESLRPPSLDHPMGTDQLGRDLFSRIIFGARISIYIAVGAVTLGVLYALTIGLISAWFGGKVDMLLSRVVDANMTIPFFLLLLIVSSVVGPGLINVILVLSLFGISESRIVRAQALTIKAKGYIEAAEVIGCGVARMLLCHMLPNVFPVVLVLATLRFGTVILAESMLSFLGFGVPPPFPSWGRMLGEESRLYLFEAPWLAIFPGVILSLAVWGFNVFGDAVRDLLDPQLRGTRGTMYR